MSSEHKDRMEDAIRQALDSRAGNLLSIAKSYFPELTNSGYLKKCPWCGDTGQTFAVRRAAAGHWYWGCHKSGCAVNFDSLKADRMGDAIGFIAMREGKSRNEAVDLFLNMAGVPNPRKEWEEQQGTKKKTGSGKKKPAEKAPEPVPEAQEEQGISLTEAPPEEKRDAPAHEPTVWDDIYSRLSLSASDREQLKRKRGFSRETIEAAGYRSSVKENRAALAPILENYPPGLLLSEGIATKDKETGQIKINSQLCGWGLKKRGTSSTPEEWDWTNPVLMPYRDKHGRVIGIRPHKGGLSGKQFMREQGFELAFRASKTRSHLYTSFLFWERPEKWERRCVLTEGEHKANALAQCGIPACAVPGIQMPRNEIFFEEMLATLRDAGIREVIVAYDNEDKSHKADPWDRYDVEVYALYVCHTLRATGILTSHCILPDEWRIDGKADWDGALAAYKADAAGKFRAALKKAHPYFPQGELFSTKERDRVVQCKLNRLLHTPQILTGGDEEEEIAKLVLKTKGEWRRRLGVQDIADTLRAARGCYYVHARPNKDLLFGTGKGKNHEPGLYEFRDEIMDERNNTPSEDLEALAAAEAALAAVNLLIKGRIEILSDFVISCDFQVRTQQGEVQRLFRFKNKHGQTSDPIQVPPSACATSSKFREFCMGVGNFNPMLGDKHLQQLMQDLGTFSAWREIRELEMLGRDPESNLWIFGDCAFSPGADLFAPAVQGQPDVLFADKHDIIWHDGIGYRIDPRSLSEFTHRESPKFFQVLGMEPNEVYAEIKANPQAEQIEVAKIFLQYCADMICTFGDAAGLLVIGATVGYAVAPELLSKYHGQPGIWIHGRGGAGKSETTRNLMMTWGFDPGYRTFMLTGGTTAVAIDRALAQYGDIPLHADEFRQDEVDKARISSLRGPFNRQSKAKGKMDQTNKTRAVQPMTSPIVTGEGVTNDSATLSRYVEAILAADKRLGTKDDQRQRYLDMQARSPQLHRIIRWFLLNRKKLADMVMKELDAFLRSDEVIKSIHIDRLRLTYGTAFSTVTTLVNHFTACLTEATKTESIGEWPMSNPDRILLRDHFNGLLPFTIAYARNAAADVISINFVVKFWSDVVTFANINSSNIRKFIWFEWCYIEPGTNRVRRSTSQSDGEGVTRCVIVKPRELYAEYQQESRKRGHEPELSFSNIRSECQNEPYWVHAPKNRSRQAHQLTFEGHGYIDVWVLRCDRMDPSVQAVFAEQFEKNDTHDEDEHLHF